MKAPTVIIDLSNVLWIEDRLDWDLVDQMMSAWRTQRDPDAAFYGVLDTKTWYRLDGQSQSQVRQWQRQQRLQVISYADPVLLDLAERHPRSVIITTDKFRDHRRDRPWLQGTDRVIGAVMRQGSIAFDPTDMSPIDDYEMSMRMEDADLKPRGIVTPEAKQALLFDWACSTATCVWSKAPQIDEDPAFGGGGVLCPECKQPAGKLGARANAKEIVVLLDDFQADRIPLSEGSSLVFGRGRKVDHYDVRSLLPDSAAAFISRSHVAVHNVGGSVFVEELGSKNGTDLVREGGVTSPLPKGVRQRLQPTDRLSLANGQVRLRLSGRRRVRGAYTPDLATPPQQKS